VNRKWVGAGDDCRHSRKLTTRNPIFYDACGLGDTMVHRHMTPPAGRILMLLLSSQSGSYGKHVGIHIKDFIQPGYFGGIRYEVSSNNIGSKCGRGAILQTVEVTSLENE